MAGHRQRDRTLKDPQSTLSGYEPWVPTPYSGRQTGLCIKSFASLHLAPSCQPGWPLRQRLPSVMDTL